jgi:hypothetical protein
MPVLSTGSFQNMMLALNSARLVSCLSRLVFAIFSDFIFKNNCGGQIVPWATAAFFSGPLHFYLVHSGWVNSAWPNKFHGTVASGRFRIALPS